MTRLRVAILISGSGSNMVKLVQSMTGDHRGRAVLVISDVANAPGLGRAEELSIPTHFIEGCEKFDSALDTALNEARVDIVCLAGFMRILSPEFVMNWAGKMLNIHPSLLPKYRGLHTHKRALDAGDSQHGCSVHAVTAALDSGPILGQSTLDVAPDDTPHSLASRVQKLEHVLYPAVLKRFSCGDTSLLTLS